MLLLPFNKTRHPPIEFVTAYLRVLAPHEGEFNEKILQKLVTKLNSTFESFKPDKAIMLYLNQHTRQLGLEPPSFASPKEKQHNSDRKSVV